MTRFIRSESGRLVNAASINWCQPVYAKAGNPQGFTPGTLIHYLVYGDFNSSPDTFSAWEVESLAGTLVPAAAGQRGLVLSSDAFGGPMGKEPEYWTTWMPIVAWFCTGPSASPVPIFPESLATDDKYAIEMPDGRLLVPEDTEYADRDAWVAGELRAWKAEEERAAGKAAAGE